jgi:hypothetical protein
MSFTDRFKTRPLSYSQLSSFEYSPKEWHKRYNLKEPDPPNAAMLFGSRVGDSIATPDSLVPSLTPPGVKEYEMRANLGPIHIIGFADHYDPETLVLNENKTTDNPKKWNKKSVDAHGQMTMYALLLYLQNKTKPEDVTMYLNYIPVLVGNDFQYYLPTPPTYTAIPTRRTTTDIMRYVQYIKDTVEAMEAYTRSVTEHGTEAYANSQ